MAVQRQRPLWLRLIVANPAHIDYSPGRSRRRRERGGRRRDADAMHFCLRYGCFLVDHVLLKVNCGSIQVSIILTSTMDRPHEVVVADEIEFSQPKLIFRVF